MKLNIPRALIQIQGTFGIGKSLAAHVALNALSIKVNQGQYQKWKYDEVFHLFKTRNRNSFVPTLVHSIKIFPSMLSD